MAPNVEASLTVLKRALQESLRKAEAAWDADDDEMDEARRRAEQEKVEAEMVAASLRASQAQFPGSWIPWCSSCTTPQEVAEVEVPTAPVHRSREAM
mmetsp:Transcript_33546/g.62845  ORF Transcript_33546/g.62845 Transcript_33546/m.62845 type:complete len:97 (-) Transcript_33546:83-373(-)